MDELLKELQILIELEIRAETAAHNFAKSFTQHPKGCVYCTYKRD